MPESKESFYSDQELALISKFDHLDQKEADKWNREIECLERRLETNYVDIDIGGGDTIAIRASVSEKEMNYIAGLEKKRLALDQDTDREEISEITYEILSIMTANPLLTKEYFAENSDKYSTEDMLKVMLGYYDQMVQRVTRAKSIESFRTK